MFSSTTVQYTIGQIRRIYRCNRLDPKGDEYKRLDCENLKNHKELRDMLKRTKA